MKVIKELSEMIREELEDSEQYAKCAIHYKEEDNRLAEMFLTLSKQELDHANMEHDNAVRIIRDNKTEPPESMKIVWEWEHNLLIDKTARIKYMHDIFRR